MADGDLNTQFEKISDKAKAAADKLKAPTSGPETSSKATSPPRGKAPMRRLIA